MTRRKMIAGNWKLHKTVSQARELAQQVRQQLDDVRDCDIVIVPPYTALATVKDVLQGSAIQLGAQDLFWEDQGAHTGAVSGPLLKDAGCSHVLVAHSERRQFFGETHETSRLRVAAALRAGLVPILCVGETLEERQKDLSSHVVSQQLSAGIQGLSVAELSRLVIAYEPVWAIGTGQVATPAQAQEIHALVRSRLAERDAGVAASMRLLYGGSVKPDNAAELLSQPDIDGALVGGASLAAQSFADIARAR